MGNMRFRDRADAGRVLAGRLAHHRGDPGLLVLALPRGGVPVGREVADSLGSPLDIFLVRKLGVPGHEELAMGAIASGGAMVLNEDVVRRAHVGPDDLDAVTAAQWRELRRREAAYRGATAPIELVDRLVIVVDDGAATGATMRAALTAISRLAPARIVVALPVAPATVCAELATLADEVVCASSPRGFDAVGESYDNFDQTSDDEVRALLTSP